MKRVGHLCAVALHPFRRKTARAKQSWRRLLGTQPTCAAPHTATVTRVTTPRKSAKKGARDRLAIMSTCIGAADMSTQPWWEGEWHGSKLAYNLCPAGLALFHLDLGNEGAREGPGDEEGGSHHTVGYFSSAGELGSGYHPEVLVATVAAHGGLRNADAYFCAVNGMASLAGMPASSVAVFAPRFLYYADGPMDAPTCVAITRSRGRRLLRGTGCPTAPMGGAALPVTRARRPGRACAPGSSPRPRARWRSAAVGTECTRISRSAFRVPRVLFFFPGPGSERPTQRRSTL
eukprot:COSAG06_NODE_1806_length_8346_cov_5.200437_2_plen_290_part_00